MIRSFMTITMSLIALTIFTDHSGASGLKTADHATPGLNRMETLDLETAYRIALAANPSFAAARERVQQAKQRVLQARARYYPSLDASASAQRIRLSDNAFDEQLESSRRFDPEADVQDPENYYGAGMTATWLLFDGFDRKFSHLAAKHGQAENEFSYADSKRLLLTSVSESFFSAQLALEEIKIARADKVFNQRQLKEARTRRKVGTGSLSDVLNFEIRVNSAEASLISAKRSYEVTMYGLAALLGIPGATFPADLRLAELEPESPNEMVTVFPEMSIEFAMAHRPDIQQSESAVMRITSEAKAVRAEFYPVVQVSASMDGERTHNGRFENDDFGRSVAIVMSYNLFSGGSSLAKLRETKSRLAEAEKNLENKKLQIKSEVRSALTRLVSTQKELVLQRANAELVKQNRDLTEKTYAAGQTSLVRLNEAQRDLVTSQSRLALELVNLRRAWVELKSSTGKILQERH